MFEALGIFENTLFFLLTVILFTIVYTLGSKSFIFSAFAGYLMFIALAIETGFGILENSMYIIVVGITIVSAFQIFNLSQTDSEGV